MQNTEEESKICLECGRCCVYITFIVDFAYGVTAEEYRQFYKARGYRITSLDNNSFAVTVKSVCPYLRAINGKHVCKVYEGRPELCRKYDGRRDPFFAQLCQLPKG